MAILSPVYVSHTLHNQQLSQLEKSFRLCLLKDRFPFKRKLQTIRSNIKNTKPVDKAIDSMSIAVEKSKIGRA